MLITSLNLISERYEKNLHQSSFKDILTPEHINDHKSDMFKFIRTNYFFFLDHFKNVTLNKLIMNKYLNHKYKLL